MARKNGSTNHRPDPASNKVQVIIPLTWGEIKALVEAKGVKDNDHVFMIDIGPGCREIFVLFEILGSLIEPRGDPSRAAKDRLGSCRVVEIGDDAQLVTT